MIFLEIKAVPQCLPIHSQSCTMRQLNLEVDSRRTFEGDESGCFGETTTRVLEFHVKVYTHANIHTYIHTYINEHLAWL